MTQPKTHTAPGKPRYRALKGMNYRDRRVEAGDIVDDLPKDSISWLVEKGVVVKIADELKGKVPEPATVQDTPEE